MARLLLGVSGGIAAYKAVEFVRLAIKAGHAVRVIQTETSRRFVGAATFEGVTGAPVLTGEFEPDPARGAFPGQAVPDTAPISHLELVRNADAYLIAPASANTLAKLATGHADSLVTTAALAATCPVAVAPAMNNHMYEHPATQANLEVLRSRGVTVIDPEAGSLASAGEWGVGRLPEPAQLLDAVEALVPTSTPRSLDGVRVLVTAGGTREPIDAVRYVGNRSSGRMGLALAEAAARRGAEVTVVAANVALPRPPRVHWVGVETAAELHAACLEHLPGTDVLLMAAAVADYRPAQAHDGKVKKDRTDRMNLELTRTDDVLSDLAGRRTPRQVLVGFAAEHGEGAVAYGRGKLERKGLDLVVVNDVSGEGIGFDSPDNEVTLVSASGDQLVPKATKGEIADRILDAVEDLRRSASSGTPEHPIGADGAAGGQ
jgi:phosphopantothenoylcysteine decarboxylase/phosphopantothenate--cysteine ligase